MSFFKIGGLDGVTGEVFWCLTYFSDRENINLIHCSKQFSSSCLLCRV